MLERDSDSVSQVFEPARHLGMAEVFPPETHLELLPCDDSDDNDLLRKIDGFRISIEWRRSSPDFGFCGKWG